MREGVRSMQARKVRTIEGVCLGDGRGKHADGGNRKLQKAQETGSDVHRDMRMEAGKPPPPHDERCTVLGSSPCNRGESERLKGTLKDRMG